MQTPFFHDEIEVKKQFLQLARDLFNQSDQIEKELAAAMLYANLSEYLAYNLCESLKQSVFSGSKTFWNGAVYIDLRGTTQKQTIGHIAVELQSYGFPSKEIIVPLIKNIAKNRNLIMHSMLRTPAEELEKIDAAIRELVSDSENLVDAIDDIYRGLPPSNITETLNNDGQTTEVEGVENDNGEIIVQEKEKSNGNRTSKSTARKKTT